MPSTFSIFIKTAQRFLFRRHGCTKAVTQQVWQTPNTNSWCHRTSDPSRIDFAALASFTFEIGVIGTKSGSNHRSNSTFKSVCRPHEQLCGFCTASQGSYEENAMNTVPLSKAADTKHGTFHSVQIKNYILFSASHFSADLALLSLKLDLCHSKAHVI